MGLLWRLSPKPVRKARRSARKVTHPVHAMTPKPIKKVKRAGYNATHPWEAAEHGVENQIVYAVRGRRSPRRRPVSVPGPRAGHRRTVWAATGGWMLPTPTMPLFLQAYYYLLIWWWLIMVKLVVYIYALFFCALFLIARYGYRTYKSQHPPN